MIPTNIYEYSAKNKVIVWYSPTKKYFTNMAKYDNTFYSNKFIILAKDLITKMINIAIENKSINILQFISSSRPSYKKLLFLEIVKNTRLDLFDYLENNNICTFYSIKWNLSDKLLDQLNNCSYDFYNNMNLLKRVAEYDDIKYIDYVIKTNHPEYLLTSLINYNSIKILKELSRRNYSFSSHSILLYITKVEIDKIPLFMSFYNHQMMYEIFMGLSLEKFKVIEQYPFFNFQDNIHELLYKNKNLTDYVFERYNTDILLVKPFSELTPTVIKKIIYLRSWNDTDQNDLYKIIRSGTEKSIILIKYYGLNLIRANNYRAIAEAMSYENYYLLDLFCYDEIMDEALGKIIEYKNILAMNNYAKYALLKENYSHVNKLSHHINYNLSTDMKDKCIKVAFLEHDTPTLKILIR